SYVVAGLRGADGFTTYGLTLVRVVTEIAAVLCVGAFLFAAYLVPGSAPRTASRAAVAWCLGALLSIPFTVADVFTRPLGDMLEPARLLRLTFSLEQTKAWLLTAGIALVLAVAARRGRSARVLLVVSLLGLVPVAASGHSSSGGDHDWATASLLLHLMAAALWVGGLVAVLAYGLRKGPELGAAASRFSQVALVCWIVLAASGMVNALVRLRWTSLFTTPYGLLVIAKVTALVALGVFGYFQRERGVRRVVEHGDGRALVRLAAFEVLLMLVTIGLATALGRTPPPDHGAAPPTPVELKIGYSLDSPPTLSRALVDWRFDLVLGTLAILLAVVYLLRVRRLRAGGTTWPVARTIAWLGGCVEVLLATSSGIGRYAPAVFSVDMVSNTLLAILAPVLLAMGAPVTLFGRSPRWKPHPAVVVGLFSGSFFVLYFSGLFDWALDVPLTHVGMNAWFLLSGFLFCWAVLGIDPFPYPLSPRTRKIMAFAAVGAQAVFGLVLFTTDSVFGEEFYRSLSLPWTDDLLGLQRLGGAIAWGFGVVPLLMMAFALLVAPNRHNGAPDGRQPSGEPASVSH
ncbi:MAG: cytochrome c oxidase assembly protein, partial [Kibdelosporangium sp.]